MVNFDGAVLAGGNLDHLWQITLLCRFKNKAASLSQHSDKGLLTLRSLPPHFSDFEGEKQ